MTASCYLKITFPILCNCQINHLILSVVPRKQVNANRIILTTPFSNTSEVLKLIHKIECYIKLHGTLKKGEVDLW